jgi:hypothetical protein
VGGREVKEGTNETEGQQWRLGGSWGPGAGGHECGGWRWARPTLYRVVRRCRSSPSTTRCSGRAPCWVGVVGTTWAHYPPGPRRRRGPTPACRRRGRRPRLLALFLVRGEIPALRRSRSRCSLRASAGQDAREERKSAMRRRASPSVTVRHLS